MVRLLTTPSTPRQLTDHRPNGKLESVLLKTWSHFFPKV